MFSALLVVQHIFSVLRSHTKKKHSFAEREHVLNENINSEISTGVRLSASLVNVVIECREKERQMLVK